MELTTSQVLDRAADLIEERGLWQACKPATSGGICALLAIDEVARADLWPAAGALVAYLGGSPHDVGGRVIRWNESASGQAEVIAVLRACALIEAAKENAETRGSVSV